jgi:Peptidase C13 family
VAMADEIIRRIQDHAVSRLSWSRVKATNLHIQTSALREGSVIRAHRQEIRLRRESIMVFADDAPMFNWSHPCRYLLYDARTAEHYQEVHAEFPPYLTDIPQEFIAFHQPVRLDVYDRYWPLKPILRCPFRFPKGQRYAVLFSGASNNRHTNDLEFLYRTLRDLYGFRDDHIYCLNYDGTVNYSGNPKPVGNWPGDNTPYRMPVKGPGTKAALDTVLDEIKGKIKADDFLLIHTNNHGGWSGPGQAYLVPYSGADYFAADFGAKLAQFPAHYCLMAMYEQCHSGGFNGPTIANSKATYTTVSAACLEANNSIGGAQFDPFARDWIAAMAGHTPSGGVLAFNPDVNGNGRTSAREAHQYADAVHDPYDTPVYSENSLAAGDTHLAQRYVWWWWHWCPEFIKLVEPHYVKLPIPEFYERWNTRLVPKLAEYEAALDKAIRTEQRALDPKLRDLIKGVFS